MENTAKIKQLFDTVDDELMIDQYADSSKIDEETDKRVFVSIMSQAVSAAMDPAIVLKMVAFIGSRLADSRVSFNERAQLLMAAIFNKETKRTMQSDNECIKVVNHVEDEFFFNKYNQLHLQRAIGILKGEDKAKIKEVYILFEEMLNRTTQRIFRAFSDELFSILTALADFSLCDLQFKCLSSLMKRDLVFFDRAVNMFKYSRSDTLRTFLVYSFDALCDSVDLETKIEIHLKFAECILDQKIEIDLVGKVAIETFIEKGRKLVLQCTLG